MSSGAAVLVSDGDERSALATVRSLVRAGHDVHVAGARERTLAGVSQSARPVVIQANALVDPLAYAREMAGAAQRCAARLVIPVTDAAVESLLAHRELFSPDSVLPFPSLETWRRASDKIGMMDRAREAGLGVPESVLLQQKAEIESAARPALFPAVLKPHRSVISNSDGSRSKLGVEFADDVDAYRRVVAALPDAAFPLLVQRRVQGPGEGLFALRWGGRIVAHFAHRRLREKPPAGGVSVYRESMVTPPALLAAAQRLLDGLDWQGVAMVECKRDAATGEHVFMEVNGRMWGSLQLAIDAGVDFPALLAGAALGGPVTPVSSYKAGVRSRWFWGDVDHLYARLAKSPRALHLAEDAPSRLRVVRDFFALPRKDVREEIWRWNDRWPFLLESARRFRLSR